MEIRTESDDEGIRVIIKGAIDGRGAEQMKSEFMRTPLVGIKYVVFNFSEVTHVGSAGLGKLLLFYKYVASAGAVMRVEGCSPDIGRLLRELKLDSLFVVA